MDYRGALKEIGQGVIRPVYTLYGTEPFLLKEFIGYIVKKTLDAGLEEFNYSTYDMTETPIQVAVQDAETPPFMGERRVVVVSGAFFLTGVKAPSGIDHQLDALLNYIQNPMESTVLLIVVTGEKLDERKKLVKLLKENAPVLPFLPLKDKELISWVTRRVQKSRASIDESAVDLMIHYVGSDLRLLGQEIEKMASYVGEGGKISEDTVYQLATRTLEQDIFALVEHIIRLDTNRALRIFYDLLKNKEEPLSILSLLARQFRLILQVKELSARGYSPQQIAASIGMHPYPVKLALGKAGNFQEKALRSILAYLAEEDYRIKTGGIDKVLSIELFMLRMTELLKTQV